MARQSIPYSLRRKEAVRPGMVRILNAMGQTARELSEKPDSELEKSIHDIRTLIKRLRTYLWFLRPVIGKNFHARSNAALRKAAQRLSKTRDLHAIASALTKAASLSSDEAHRQALVEVSQAFAGQTAQNGESPDLLLEKVADTVVHVISKATSTVKRNAGEMPSPGHRLKKAFGRMRRAMRKAKRKKDPRLVHEWRKKTKRHFYILQLTVNLPHMGMTGSLKKVDKLQEHLGDFQDNVVAENHLRAHPPYVDAADLKRAIYLLRQNRKILRKEAHHCWDAILEEV